MTMPDEGADRATGALAAPAAPVAPASDDALEELLSRPGPAFVDMLARLPGDLLVLGAGGKMGPSLVAMARRALDQAGDRRRVIAASRWRDDAHGQAARLRALGVEVERCDLADRNAVAGLPDAPNVVFMAGQKFGTSADPAGTWAANILTPAIVAERFRDARLVVFSTANVYPLSPAGAGGSRETDPLTPLGEYANSCVGRERVVEHLSRAHKTRTAVVRLSYAIDLRYGVLLDIGRRVWQGEPVDLRMGWVNVVWQGDANDQALRLLEHAASPPVAVNVTGPEPVAVQELAERLGELLERAPVFSGAPGPDALLSDTSLSRRLLGPPGVPMDWMLRWTASWIRRGGTTLAKPTHFEARDGRY